MDDFSARKNDIRNSESSNRNRSKFTGLFLIISTTTTLALSVLVYVHVNGDNVQSKNERPFVTLQRDFEKLSQPSTWYFPTNTKTNNLGYEWNEVNKQTTGSVYIPSVQNRPASDIIYQSPQYEYNARSPATHSSDMIYQRVGTTQNYNSGNPPSDIIPQYITVWNSPDSSSTFGGNMGDVVYQSTGTNVATQASRAEQLKARVPQAARTQLLADEVIQMPSTAKLDSIQNELNSLKDHRRRSRAGPRSRAARRAAAALARSAARHQKLMGWQSWTAPGAPPCAHHNAPPHPSRRRRRRRRHRPASDLEGR
jgi:hypothetical protein